MNYPYIAATVLDELREAAARYSYSLKMLSGDQWLIAELAERNFLCLCEEFADEGIQDRPTREQSDHAVAEFINAVAEERAISEYTVKYYRQVAAHYQNVPELNEYKKELSFDHFAQAVRLMNKKVTGSVQEALDRAISDALTADEMAATFDPERMNKPAREWTFRDYMTRVDQLGNGLQGVVPADKWEAAEPHYRAFVHALKEGEHG